MSAFKAAVILLVVSVSAHAVGLVKVWTTDKACPAMKPALSEIAHVPFPMEWIVVVACNDVRWEALQRKADALATWGAFTNVKGKITVVRGTIFLQSMGSRSVRRILLHEVGHIRCNCGDEGKAEAWAAWYENRGHNGTREVAKVPATFGASTIQ